MSKTKEKYNFSKEFIDFIVISSNGFLTHRQLDLLFNLLNSEANKYYFDRYSEANLIRIISSIIDKVTFLKECLVYNHHVEIIIAIAANSNYLTDIIVKNPEYLSQIYNPDYLKKEFSQITIGKEIKNDLSKFKTFQAKVNYLRRFKRRQILKIGVNDIWSKLKLESTIFQLSIIAKEIISALFDLCYKTILAKHNLHNISNKYSIIALGKLGGNELNYSSDVDLIIIYNKNSNIGKNRKIEYHQILTETIQLFIQTSTKITSNGYIYRIDFRLRPDGKNSPLCRTINDTIRYYETKGEDWERQMLIKMSFTGGNKKLYENFHTAIIPFVYPITFLIPPQEQIRKMKANIEKHNVIIQNVKLFEGGIRDIEFGVQTLQLLNGGAKPHLRTGSTLDAIDKLSDRNLLNPKEGKIFKNAYIFYRRIEHFLQLMNDQQTHSIPSNDALLQKLICFLNFENEFTFNKQLKFFRSGVRKIFKSITVIGKRKKNQNDDFHKINFNDEKKANRNFVYLQTGIGILNQSKFDKRTKELFREIEPVLIKYLQSSVYPDQVLDNFTKFIRIIPFPSIFFYECKNKKFFNLILKLCEFSQKSINLILISHTLTELLLNRAAFTKSFLSFYESYNFTQIQFILSTQYSLGLIKRQDISKILNVYVSFKIKNILEKTNLNYNYFIAASGSYGSNELTFTSDIDLIFVGENLSQYPSMQSDFQNILSQIQRELTPFEIDCRLRPEGINSPLVWEISEYKKYIFHRAKVWEFQALSKLNFVFGNKNLFNRLKRNLIKAESNLDGHYIRTKAKDMYRKIVIQNSRKYSDKLNIKNCNGGIKTIDYLIQFLIMENPKWYMCGMGKSVEQKMNYLIKVFNNKEKVKQLRDAYSFFREIEILLQILFEQSIPLIPSNKDKLNLIAKKLNFRSGKSFLTSLTNEIQNTQNIITTIINNE